MNYPEPVDRETLQSVLLDVAQHVAASDSFEGFIEYSMPTDEIVPDGTYALLRARYRIGNSMGQGGLRAIGRMYPPPMVDLLPAEPGEVRLDIGPVPDYTAEDIDRSEGS